jgi:hypothetical protein
MEFMTGSAFFAAVKCASPSLCCQDPGLWEYVNGGGSVSRAGHLVPILGILCYTLLLDEIGESSNQFFHCGVHVSLVSIASHGSGRFVRKTFQMHLHA